MGGFEGVIPGCMHTFSREGGRGQGQEHRGAYLDMHQIYNH